MLSACAESMIVSAPPADCMILSGPFDCVLMLTHKQGAVGGNKKTTISDTDNCQLTIIINSALMAALIGLPPKMAQFCHTSNRLLVGRQCHCAIWQLYLIPLRSVVWLFVGCLLVSRWSTISVPVLWEVSLQKDKGSRALGGFSLKGLIVDFMLW
jgi:hypothetical protein